jgi:hypothetical protein
MLCQCHSSLQVYNKFILGGSSNIEKCRERLAGYNLFSVGTPQVGVFRGRQLTEFRFSPDVNFATPRLSVWTETNGKIVGVSAVWKGNVNGFSADILYDEAAWRRYTCVRNGFEEIVGYNFYFLDKKFISDDEGYVEILIDEHKKWLIQINRSESLFDVGTDLHRELSPKDNSKVYNYLATAQKW